MESGIKLAEIFDHYPNPVDLRMIGDFWANLENYERMLLKKAETQLQKT